jgi:microcystin-dependent protein
MEVKKEQCNMSEPFLAEIKIVGFNFAPRGWALCDGQILPITFALPELRGRVPIHVGASNAGSSHSLGQKGGEETNTLTTAQIPQHTHDAHATSNQGDNPIPDGRLLGNSSPSEIYHGASSLVPLHSGTIGNQGGGQGHENMQPFTVVNFCIALQGVFPSRN